MSASTIPATARSKEYTPTVRVVALTPAIAEEMLNRNALNRPLKQGRVERYARDMRAGKWRMNAETIKLTAHGEILDGQHRLFAVIESGVTIQAMVVEGLPEDVMPTIDTGAPRSFGDVIAIRGGKNTALTAAIVRLLAWHQLTPRPAAQPSFTHSEMDAAFAKNRDAAERAAEINSCRAVKQKIAAPSVIGFVFTLAHRQSPEKAREWLDLLGTGAGLNTEHPIYQFRERMIGDRGSRAKLGQIDVCALCVKSWNNHVSGHRSRLLVWKSTEPFPDVMAVDAKPPRSRHKSVTP